MKWWIGLSLLFALTGCGEKINNAPRPGEQVQLPEIEWRVVDRQTLMHAYQANGMQMQAGQKLEGFAGVTADGRNVVYTLPPQTVDDVATCTLGHEVLHVVLGKYHKEK